MLPKTTSCDYLDDPVISAYFEAKEVRAYFESIKHAYPRRDYHSVAIDVFEKFLAVGSTTDGIEVLNKNVFNSPTDGSLIDSLLNEGTSPAGISVSASILQDICPAGYSLMKLVEPISFDSLKKAYRRASMAHHPDRGGAHVDMVEINTAYKIFHDVLCDLQHKRPVDSESETVQSKNDFFALPSNAEDFVYLISAILAEIYCDEWGVDNAYALIHKLRDVDYYDSDMPENNGNEIFRLVKLLTTLSKRLNKAGRSSEAVETLEFAKHIYQVGDLDYAEGVERPEDIVLGKKNLRVILNHPRQAKNALDLGVIDAKRYGQLIEKFHEAESVLEEKKQLLLKFLHRASFADLPFDTGINRQIAVVGNIPEIGYGADIKIVNRIPDQQAEYLIAFSNNTNLDLVLKYTYVRLASYLMSLQQNISRSLVETIITECSLLKEIYEDGTRASARTLERITGIISDLEDLRVTASELFQGRLDEIMSTHEYLLSDHSNDTIYTIEL